MTRRTVRHSALALAVLIAAAWFASLDVRPLYKADESRYGEIAREMVATGDWVTPRLNGFKYFEKPPLQYWATAAAYEIFGEHDWTARLWTALLALAGVALTFFAGRRLYGARAAALGALVLAGSPLYVLLGQVNTLDMGVSVFLSAAMYAFALRRDLLFGVACAAAMLSKGLIGIVLPAAAIGLFVLLGRDWKLVLRMRLVAGAALFLALAAPWFAALSASDPHFFHFFFVQEHFERFTTHMHHRVEPWWYFAAVLAAGFAPWVLALPGAVARAWRDEAGRLLVLWSAVVFVFFSASGSKLPPYILPMFPAIALLVGRYYAGLEPRRLLMLQCALGVAGGIALILSAPYIVRGFSADLAALAANYRPWLIVAGALLAALAGGGFFLALRKRTAASVMLLALGAFAASLLAIDGTRAVSPAYSIESTLAQVKPPIPSGARVFAVETYDHTLPWTLKRTVTMVGYKDELEQAVGWEAAKFVPDLATFAREWSAAREPVYAVFSARDFERLRAQLGVPMRVLARGPRYVIVAKP